MITNIFGAVDLFEKEETTSNCILTDCVLTVQLSVRTAQEGCRSSKLISVGWESSKLWLRKEKQKQKNE